MKVMIFQSILVFRIINLHSMRTYLKVYTFKYVHVQF